MKTMVAGFIVSLAVALVPVPQITVQNPTLLYAAAMYKIALGDTQSALRLMQRAEQVQQPAAIQHPNTAQAVCDRAANLLASPAAPPGSSPSSKCVRYTSSQGGMAFRTS